MCRIRELVPGLRSKPSKPILHHFPDDRCIPDWADAGDWIRRGQVAAERRTTDRHREQPIVIVNRFRTAEQIDVKTIRPATRSNVDT